MGQVATFKQCGCRDENTGRLLGRKCPKLRRGNGWSPVHGTWYYQIELPPRADGTRRAPLRHGGFATDTSAKAELGLARELLAIAPPGDPATAVRIADAITAATRATVQLPDPARSAGRSARAATPPPAAHDRGMAGGMDRREEEAAARHGAQLREPHPPVPQAPPRGHSYRPAPGHRRRLHV